MNENNNISAESKQDVKESRFYTLRLLAVTVMAFVAALLFRRSMGIVAMIPISLVICASTALIDIGFITRTAMVGTIVFILNSIENKNMETVVLYTALCILATLLASYSVYKIRANKKIGITVASASGLLCIALSVIFIGNPFSAMAAKDVITPYTDKNYPINENAALGIFEFSAVYYDYKLDAYCVDAKSDKFPTEPSPISVSDGKLYDSFYYLLESKISRVYESDLSSVLRENLPDATFSVKFDGFVSMPGDAILSKESGALYNNVRYDIFIGGIQTAEAMTEAVEEMVNVIDASGIGYAQLTFKSGIGLWLRRCVTVTPYHPTGRFVPKMTFVPVLNTNEFSEYIRYTILSK